ncbi:hypothetical protein PV327_007597 [Microctonus hyperodae]|uniref:Uncharacterized protein n=1 Tax=Microctonus hyperodae TaxID=165561 RepID=A0AA39KYS1_MICHY|nr:hypothetical protein PV327_007597 [Microctonus hyperodae]
MWNWKFLQMWSLFAVIITLLSTAASRTEPIDILQRDHQNEMLSPGSLSRDFVDLKELTAHLKQMELDNLKDQRQEWNKNEDKYDINSRKFVPIEAINENIYDDLNDGQVDEPDEFELNQLTNFLSTLLKQPVWMTPLAVVEEPIDDLEDETINEIDNRKLFKRSRYYRRYPWKRQNNRTRKGLEYESLYLCKPSREDVFKLLVALHDVRQGNKTRT